MVGVLGHLAVVGPYKPHGALLAGNFAGYMPTHTEPAARMRNRFQPGNPAYGERHAVAPSGWTRIPRLLIQSSTLANLGSSWG